MKNIFAISLLALTGCTPIFLTDPDFAVIPKDQVKYQKDLKECEEEQKMTAGEAVAAGLLPGMAPVSAVMIGEGKGDNIFKSRYTIREECLKKRGYVFKD